MIEIVCRGRVAATVIADEVTLSPDVAVLEQCHPVRRWVVCLAMFAGYILDGTIDGPYSERRAAHFGRLALLPSEEFAQVQHLADEVLAERFKVPLEQIAEKREDFRWTRWLDRR